MPSGHRLASVGGDRPEIMVFIEYGTDNTGIELDVFAQVESINHMIGVIQNICLIGVFVFPLPFLLQGLVKAVGVLQARNITPRARIAVPIPSAANSAGRLINSGFKAFVTQVLKRINTREARTDNHGVKICCY